MPYKTKYPCGICNQVVPRASTFEPDVHTALPRQKEVMTIFMFLRYGIKTKFCLIYPIFNEKFKIFDA